MLDYIKNSYMTYWKGIFRWRGRANRIDFWFPISINMILVYLLASILPLSLIFVLLLFHIMCFFANLSVYVRRFHDIGISAFISVLIPLILMFTVAGSMVQSMVSDLTSAMTNTMEKTNIDWAQTLSTMSVANILMGICSILILLGLCWPGQKEANKYGTPRTIEKIK